MYLVLMSTRRQALFCRIGEAARVFSCGILRGPYVGCGLKDDISIPHLLNWRTQQVHSLAPEPNAVVSVSVTCRCFQN